MARRLSPSSHDVNKIVGRLVIAVVAVIIVVPLSFRFFQVVPAGHVAVATLFGKVQPAPYKAGLHFPVNPLLTFHEYDARQKTHKENADVPSQDQLSTKVDVSVQYRVNGDMASAILSDTGTAAQLVEVHLVPKLRSLLREQGKSIVRAEDFFREETQQRLQTAMLDGLRTFCDPKGLTIEDVLIRDINLPARLIEQIEEKKKVEQQAERQKAELDRFRTEQEQKIAQAEAERKAAEQEAEQVKLLADAQAYEIQKINEAISDSPGYIQLQAIKALETIASDPAAKIYFLNGESPMPLPLMHMGELN